MKQLIEKYQSLVDELESSLLTIQEMIEKSKTDSRIDREDLIEEKENCKYSISTYSQFIKDIENCETLILIDNIIDVFDHNPCSTTGFSMITVETPVLERLKDISKAIK